jgi:hypothetical protein
MSDHVLNAKELRLTCPDNATLREEITVSSSCVDVDLPYGTSGALTTI